ARNMRPFLLGLGAIVSDHEIQVTENRNTVGRFRAGKQGCHNPARRRVLCERRIGAPFSPTAATEPAMTISFPCDVRLLLKESQSLEPRRVFRAATSFQ